MHPATKGAEKGEHHDADLNLLDVVQDNKLSRAALVQRFFLSPEKWRMSTS